MVFLRMVQAQNCTVFLIDVMFYLFSFIFVPALVLLCLLHAVFGQDQFKFSWQGPVVTTATADPKPDISESKVSLDIVADKFHQQN